MNRNIIATALGLCVLLGCDSRTKDNYATPITELQLSKFAELFERNFQTPKTNEETIILDRRVAVSNETSQGLWFYTQLNTGKEQKLYRQRLAHITISTDRTYLIQKTYALNIPEKFENAWKNTNLLSNINSKDYVSLFTEGCELIWTPLEGDQWSGKVDPQNCVIESKRRNKKIRIGSVSFLSKDKYQTSETGYEMDMTYLWGSEAGELIDLFPHQ